MKTRPSLELALINHQTGEQTKLRMLAKPCRSLSTRYWLVLPGQRSRRERWFMEPTVEHAVQRASAWLMQQALACFSLTAASARSAKTFPYQPASPDRATPKQQQQK